MRTNPTYLFFLTFNPFPYTIKLFYPWVLQVISLYSLYPILILSVFHKFHSNSLAFFKETFFCTSALPICLWLSYHLNLPWKDYCLDMNGPSEWVEWTELFIKLLIYCRWKLRNFYLILLIQVSYVTTFKSCKNQEFQAFGISILSKFHDLLLFIFHPGIGQNVFSKILKTRFSIRIAIICLIPFLAVLSDTLQKMLIKFPCSFFLLRKLNSCSTFS